MKKIIIFSAAFILIFSALFSLSACDGGNDGNDGNDSSDTIRCEAVYLHVLDPFYPDSIDKYTTCWSVSNIKPTEVEWHAKFLSENKCAIYGYTFHGIYSEPNGKGDMYVNASGEVTKPFQDAVDPSGVINFYAHHIPKKFSMTLVNGNENTFFEFDIYSENAALPVLESTEYLEHIGWKERKPETETVYTTLSMSLIRQYYTEENSYRPSLEAVFRGKLKEVTLDPAEGTIGNNTAEVRYYEEYTLPVPTPPEGKLFLGWAVGSTHPITNSKGQSNSDFRYTSSSVTFTAIYGNKVTLSIDVNASGPIDTASLELLQYDDTSYTAPFIPGRQFDRMHISSGGSIHRLDYSDIENDSTYYGTMRIDCKVNDNGTITFDFKDVTENVTVNIYYASATTILESTTDAITVGNIPTLRYGHEFSLPIAYKAGYRFNGWRIVGTEAAITDASGKGLAVWTNQDRKVMIEPILIQDSNAPMAIFDAATLLMMQNNPSGKYILLNDITLTNADSARWKPFAFSGELNGCNFSISGLTLTSSSGNVGMFTSVSGTIKNFALDNVSITSLSNNKVNVGAICANLTGTLERVFVYGEVSADHSNVGGLCGYVNGGKITNSTNYASVCTITLESGSTMGGIAGYVHNATIKNCKNRGDVSGFANVGGIVGYVDGENRITESSNYANVTAGSGYVGGCVGKFVIPSSFNAVSVSFNTLSNSGNVKASGSHVGGVLGYCSFYGSWWDSSTFVMDFYKLVNSGNVEGSSYVGGCVGYATSSTGKGAYSPKISIKLTDNTNSGNITASNTAGGCIGYGNNSDNVSKIIRSSSSGTITVKHTAGGIAGVLGNFTIDTCNNSGTTINATSYYLENNGYYVKIGGFVGQGSTVVNCTNTANIEYEEKGCYIGGIAGVITTTVTNCSNEGNINAPKASHVGGIVGRVSHNTNHNISNLTNSGSVTAHQYVGGILGSFYAYFSSNDSDEHTTTIKEISSSGSVYSYAGYCGGLFGSIEGNAYDHDMRFPKFKLVISFVECSSDVECESTLATGALIGYVSTDCDNSIMDAYSFTGLLNNKAVSKSELIGGTYKFTLSGD